MNSRAAGWCGAFCLVISVILAFSATADEDESEQERFSEYDIKAAYLINFVRYLEWPSSAFEDESGPFLLGILGKNPFGDTLAKLAGEQKYGDRAIEIRYGEDIEGLKSCHLIFFSSAHKGDFVAGLRQVDDRPVLTVGERKGFTEKGGVVNFAIVETRVKFEINLKEARKKKLKIRSQLLKVAINVIK